MINNLIKYILLITIIILPIFSKDNLIVNDIEIDNSKNSSSFSKYIQKVFSGEMYVSRYTGNIGNTKTNYLGFIRYNDSFFNFLKLKVEYQLSKVVIARKYKLSYYSSDEKDLPQERIFTKTYYDNGIKEAYLDIDINDYISLSVGRQIILWGQFDMISPVDLFLPFKQTPTGMSIGKVYNRLPQDALIVKLYPIEQLEIQGYYFPNITRDPVVDDYIENGVVNYNYIDGNKRVDVEQPSNSEDYQTALRAIYFGDSITFGFTYYNGWEPFFSNNAKLITLKPKVGQGEPAYRSYKYPKVQKLEMYGLEVSVPVGKWSWKFEIASRHRNIEFEKFYYKTYSAFPNYQERLNLINWINTKNNGNLYVPARETLTAFGFDYSSSKWLINTMLIYIREDFDSSEDEEKYNLSKDLSDDDLQDVDIIPSFNIVRYFNDSKETFLGFAAGLLSSGGGATLYFKDTIFSESFSYAVSYEYIKYFSDGAPADDTRYKIIDDKGGYRVGLSYKF